MYISHTLSFYLSRQFLLWMLGMLLVLIAIVEIFDVLELFRRTAGHEDVTSGTVLSMAGLKIPHYLERLMPFSVLFGAMFTFFRMNRHHELVVARASGVSAWQFLLPVIVLALALGAFQITAFNPFAAAMLLEYEKLEAKHIRGKPSLAAVSEEGIWLRQRVPDGHYILHAPEVSPGEMELRDVVVFRFRTGDRFVGRIDAPSARLVPGNWQLTDARINDITGSTVEVPSYRLMTDLTTENINDSFAPPETLSFWTLPRFIAVLEKAGFSALRHRIDWHSRLAHPFLLCAMVLLAATFSLRNVRRGGAMAMVAAGVGAGFVLFFVSDVIGALSASGGIPVLLGAWSPTAVSGLLGLTVLFHLEDG